jgi:hypothetical protein
VLAARRPRRRCTGRGQASGRRPPSQACSSLSACANSAARRGAGSSRPQPIARVRPRNGRPGRSALVPRLAARDARLRGRARTNGRRARRRRCQWPADCRRLTRGLVSSGSPGSNMRCCSPPSGVAWRSQFARRPGPLWPSPLAAETQPNGALLISRHSKPSTAPAVTAIRTQRLSIDTSRLNN